MYHQILTKKGYIIEKNKYDSKFLNNLKTQLVLYPYRKNQAIPRGNPISCFDENEKYIILPRYFGFVNFGDPKQIILPPIQKITGITPNFNGTLTYDQQQVLQCIINSIYQGSEGTGLLCLPCGSGKTVIACALIAVSSIKTIVITKASIMYQWTDALAKFTNLRVGLLQGKICQIDNVDVVVASLNTYATLYKHQDDIINRLCQFSALIIDEVHTISCYEMINSVKLQTYRYQLGMSATIYRTDKMEQLIIHYMGDIVYSRIGTMEQPHTPTVKIFENDGDRPGYYGVKINPITKIPDYSAMISSLTKDKKRNEFIRDIILSLLSDTMRHILFITTRKSHIDAIYSMLSDTSRVNMDTVSLMVGSTTYEDKLKARNAHLILGIEAVCSTGMNITCLNTLIFGTPTRSKTEQIVGRILRKQHKQVVPLIIDINDFKYGGILIENSECNFSEENLNSIYLNYGGKINDIFYLSEEEDTLEIHLDTFQLKP